MNIRIGPFLAFLALALFLGFGSVWPEEGLPPLLSGLGHSLLFLAVFVLFVYLLPHYFNRPMQIFWGMLLGVLAGWGLTALDREVLVTDYFGIFGTLFIQLLTMVVVPLIFASIVSGVANIGDVRRLGGLGAKTLGYYCCTTALAVLIGLLCVNLIRPGVGQEHLEEQIASVEEAEEEREPTLGSRIQDRVLPEIIPNVNISAVPIIPIIFSALLFGAVLAAIPNETEPALRFFQAVDKAIIQIVLWIMYLAPIGVFALMGNVIATMGLEYIPMLALYVFTVIAALALHFVVLVFIVLPLLGGISPKRFLRGMAPAIQLAFSSSSSSATLPVTMDCATRRVGSSKKISSFMLPLGATINMDGTALYQAVAVLFIAQVYAVGLTLPEQFLVFLTAVVVSIGTAGIPGASVGLMSIVLASVGLPLEGIGIVIGVDRFLDMCRTLVNINGDAVGTVVVSQLEHDMGEPDPY
ncbi:MAG: dicarboxylate/amino acid:cation symporter [Candidatus Hydrogenedentota bacterium]